MRMMKPHLAGGDNDLSSVGGNLVRVGVTDVDYISAILALHVCDDMLPSYSEDGFCSWLSQEGVICWGYILAGEVVAAILFRCVGGECELLTLVVNPDYRRRGLASMLLSLAEDEARQRACNIIHLEVREDNIAAVELYRLCGFVVSGRRAKYYRTCLDGRDRVDAVMMSKEV